LSSSSISISLCGVLLIETPDASGTERQAGPGQASFCSPARCST
jgi:hypothetical protein